MLQDKETFCPASRKEWRQWLKRNHASKPSIWLVCYKKNSTNPSIPWSELVDEALCFGWIDSIRKPVDDDQFVQFFTKRKPKSIWSKINKEKIQRLTKEGLMTKAGHESVEIAKQNGSWKVLDQVEELKIPRDLSAALKLHTGSKQYFVSLSKSMKKQLLYWVISAKRPETRQKRIDEVVTCAAQKKKPEQFLN